MAGLTPEEIARLKAAQAPKTSVVFTNLASVEPRQAPFLWYPYFPLGKVVIVAGAPGHGKSQFAAMVAGMASRGSFYPGVGEPSRSLLMCAEDDLATTVVPRLLATNADLRMVDTVNVVTEHPSGLTEHGLIALPTDSEIIHEWAKRYIDARLVVLDPVASFFDRNHNTLFNQDVRDALGPLVAIAATYGVTVVIILHLNKSESRDFANRVAESHGFQALARSVLALGPDPEDKDGERGKSKIIAVTKANLIKPGTYSIRCEVRTATLTAFTPPIETSELVMLGKCDVTADDLLMNAGERTTRMEAHEWLVEFLDGGWRKTGDVRKAAISDGFSWRMIERIRQSKGFQRVKQPGVKHGPWWIGDPRAHTRDLPPASGGVGDLDRPQLPPGVDDLDGLGGIEPQDNQDRPRQGGYRAREADQDEFMRWERKRLGEDDDDEEDGDDG